MNLKPTLQLDAESLSNWYEFGEPFVSTYKLLYDIISKNQDIFDQPHKREMNREELRALCNRQLVKVSQGLLEHFKKGEFVRDFRVFSVPSCVLFQYDMGLSIKFAINFQLYLKNFIALAGDPVHEKILQRGINIEEWGAFLMTEVGHGSNVQGVMTTATYDKSTQEFMINTPDDMAAKFWIGNLAKTATMGVVIAQLIVEGKNHGVHLFAVPLRDKETHEVYPGIVIGDCGPKHGMHVIDNGAAWFQNYRIPREYMLNKISNVSPDGVFTSKERSKSKRFGMHMSALSSGRVGLSYCASQLMTNAVTTALRYASVRQQFNNHSKTREHYLLEYPLHQQRLIPILAKAVAYKLTMKWMILQWASLSPDDLANAKNPKAAEAHAISAGLKPLIKWDCMKSLQQCREACGGHGYSAFARFGNWKDDYDVNLTWEGDNNVLIQQTIRWLLTAYQKSTFSKYESLKPLEDPASEKFDPKDLISALKWKVISLLEESVAALGKEGIVAWNDLQGICLQKLALSLVEYFSAYRLREEIKNLPGEGNKQMVAMLLENFCVSKILADIGEYRKDDFMSSEQANELKYRLRALNAKIVPNVLDFVDVVASPDFILNSSLGMKDRKNLYKRYLNDVRGAKDFHSRTPQWRELFPRPVKPRPKL